MSNTGPTDTTAVVVSPPLPADDLEPMERDAARLLTVYHRAGVGGEQAAAARAQVLTDLAALRDQAFEADPPLATHLTQLLAVLPGTRYTREPNGAWRCVVPGYGFSDSRPVPA